MRKKPIVALVYDFDGTLSPGNMQEFGFIQAIGLSPEVFWTKCDEIAKGQDASNILSYMKFMLNEAKSHGIRPTREGFRNFGRNVELYEGVRGWFSLINDYGKRHGVVVEHYINSSGLMEIIEGTPIAHEFKRIFACSYLYNNEGEAEWPSVAVDFTAKTQFLFKINKGIFSIRDNKLVNESQDDEKKRVPFSNMIYFGDGETDVPSMKVVNMFGGNPIAVYNPDKVEEKETAEKMLRQGRVKFIAPATYTKNSRVYKIVCTIIDNIRSEHELRWLSKKA